jgi:hypothetical protein
MSAIIGTPPLRDPAGNSWSEPWRNWFTQAQAILFAAQQSGTTALRPTKGLYPGRTYFDTTLVIPIWYDGAQWIDATGAPA